MKRFAVGLLGALALSVLALFAATASASHKLTSPIVRLAPASSASAPTVVSVSVLVLSVGRLELSTGSYTVDFYLTLTCDRPCDPSHFEFMNGRGTSTEEQNTSETSRTYRVLASLNQNLDLSHYPFDQHRLAIEIEDSLVDNTELVYKADLARTGIANDVLITGWDLERGWEAEVQDVYYKEFNQTYSRYIFTLHLSRAHLSAMLKTLFPAFVVAVVGLLSLFLGPDKALQRLGMLTAALGSAVILHLNLTSSLPPIGYLTYADGFMLANYVLLGGCLALTVRMVLIIDQRTKEVGNEGEAAEMLLPMNRMLQWVLPLAWVALQAFTAWFFLVR